METVGPCEQNIPVPKSVTHLCLKKIVILGKSELELQ